MADHDLLACSSAHKTSLSAATAHTHPPSLLTSAEPCFTLSPDRVEARQITERGGNTVDEQTVLSDKEKLTALVYGDTFSLYDDHAFDEFVRPLYRRLDANSIPRSTFHSARCLDAGCGGGRGSVLMAECGAREVVAVDLSEKNVACLRQRARARGLSTITCLRNSLMDLPFRDDAFDVVWCNGVLHHTADPDRGLREITRVLKPGGRLWLYLYGAGGVYWRVIYWIRETLSRADLRRTIYQLRLMGMPVRRIAEWIDDWFVPYLRTYTADDVTSRLAELGHQHTDPLAYGMGYDTSQRKVGADATEQELMGEGDLRFFCVKAGPSSGHQSPLPDPPGGHGSAYQDAPCVARADKPLRRIAAALTALETHADTDPQAYRVLVCRLVHERVRGLLETDGPLDLPAYIDYLSRLADLLDEMAS